MEGAPFGRYRLLDLLGRGGMGEVWRAYDTGTDRIVAVKLLPANFAQDPTFEQRFRREAHSAARLHNAHIVPIHDYGEIDGRLFVDMALIDGHDLATEIAAGPLPAERAVTIIEQIARALAAAHKIGLIHRDVKPSNILIGDDDTAYLIDFGIARANTDTGLTGTGFTLGTWSYMAPERFTSDAIDARSDTYALTCVLYEALTGAKPFPGDTLERQFTGHISTPPPKQSALRPDVPAALDEVIARGMAKDPEQRYPDVRDLAIAARTALSGPATPPEAPPTVVAPAAETVKTPLTQAPVSTWQPPAHPGAQWGAPVAPEMPVAMPGPPPTRPAGKPRRRRVVLGALSAVVVALVAAGTVGYKALTHTNQTVLPFQGLNMPQSVAVDAAGTVYVVDQQHNRVLSLAAESNHQTELHFPVVHAYLDDVAVDNSGTVYVRAGGHVYRLPAGADDPSQVKVNTSGETGGESFAVDGEGTVYLAYQFAKKVVALPNGAEHPVELPFGELNGPEGVAVDAGGTVYVIDYVVKLGFMSYRVLALGKGADAPTELPFTRLNPNHGIAVDSAGTVYVTEHDRVLKLPAA